MTLAVRGGGLVGLLLVSAVLSVALPLGPLFASLTQWGAITIVAEEKVMATEETVALATTKQLLPPLEGAWRENPTPILPSSVKTEHWRSGSKQRVLERLIALNIAAQLVSVKPPQCLHRPGGGTLILPTGKEEIQEAVTLFWDGIVCKVTGCDKIKAVGFLAQLGDPNLSTAFANSGLLKATYNTGEPVWRPIPKEDPRCLWSKSLLQKFYDALLGEGNGFPPAHPPVAIP